MSMFDSYFDTDPGDPINLEKLKEKILKEVEEKSFYEVISLGSLKEILQKYLN